MVVMHGCVLQTCTASVGLAPSCSVALLHTASGQRLPSGPTQCTGRDCTPPSHETEHDEKVGSGVQEKVPQGRVLLQKQTKTEQQGQGGR
jgi:hypothetical protein